jgi:hypothetical protein
VGEISSIPISPAITNAIYNAVGVRCLALPVDQDALLLAMKHGERERSINVGAMSRSNKADCLRRQNASQVHDLRERN